MTVDEAARHLRITVDAVRKRMQRGQISYEKDGAGRGWIILDEIETLQDRSPDNTEQAAGVHEELVGELRDRVHYLERVLEDEREGRTEERRRHDTLMAQLMQRIPELEAPSEARESPQSPDPSEAPTDVLRDASTAATERWNKAEQLQMPNRAAIRTGTFRWVYLLLTVVLIAVLLIIAGAFSGPFYFYSVANMLFSVVGLIQGFTSRRSFRLIWRRVVITGLLIMTLIMIVDFGLLIRLGEFSGVDIDSFNEFINVYFISQGSTLLAFGLPPALFYVSCVALGNALQPQMIDERSGLVTASATESWDSRKQALLSFLGVVGASIIQAAALLITAFYG